MKYRVVVERGPRNYSAYSPDLPGCVATGRTRAATEKQMREAIQFHLDGLRRHGLALPKRRAAAR